MPTPPFAQVQVSIAGGGNVSGGVTAAFGQSVALSAPNTTGWTAAIWEIYDYAPGLSAPAGWSTASSGVIFFQPPNPTTPPPSFNLPASGSNNWGKFAIRLRINNNPLQRNANGSPNANFTPQYTDEATVIRVPSPTLAMPGICFNETTQFDTLRSAVGDLMACLRKLDVTFGGGGTVSVTGTGILHATGSVLDGAAYKGTAGQILFTNSGATDTTWASSSQDVTYSTGTVGQATVVGLRGNAFAAPSGVGTALVWNGSSLSWSSPSISVSGSGFVHQTASVTDAGASKGTAGQFALTNAGATDIAWTSLSGDVAASVSTVGQLTVTGIQAKAVPVPSGTNTTLTWSGAALSWVASLGSVTGSGVLHNTSGSLDSAASKGTAGQALFTNGAATDTLWATITGDVSASTGSPGTLTVVGIRGNSVPNPSGTNTFLEWTGSAFTWAAGGGSSVTWANDLSGNSTTTNTNQYVSGLSFSSAVAGGSIAVNGTNTLLNWVTNAVTLQQNAVTLLQLKAASTDFVSFGASAAASGFVRANNNTTIVSARNAGGTADVAVLGTTASNYAIFGGANCAGFQWSVTGTVTLDYAATTSNVFTWASGASSPGLAQAPTAGATGTDMSVTTQASSANPGSSGNFVVKLPAGVGAGVPGLFKVAVAGTNQFFVGNQSGTNAGYVWLGPVTPSTSNTTLYCDGAQTNVNAPTSNLFLGTNGGTAVQINDQSGNAVMTIGSRFTGIEAPTAHLSFSKTLSLPIINVNAKTSDAVPQTLSIFGQDAWSGAATNVNGGAINIRGGAATLGGTTGLRGGVTIGTQGAAMVTTVEPVVGQHVIGFHGTPVSTNMPSGTGDFTTWWGNAATPPTPYTVAPTGGAMLWVRSGQLKSVNPDTVTLDITPAFVGSTGTLNTQRSHWGCLHQRLRTSSTSAVNFVSSFGTLNTSIVTFHVYYTGRDTSALNEAYTGEFIYSATTTNTGVVNAPSTQDIFHFWSNAGVVLDATVGTNTLNLRIKPATTTTTDWQFFIYYNEN